MESRLELKTKANLGKRISAGLIDYGMVSVFTAVMFFLYGEPIEGGYTLTGYPFLIVILFWAVMTIGMEQLFGVTLGNYMSDLKAISASNFNDSKISLGQSVKRHLIAIIDIWLFGLIGILLIKNTKLNQRLGDIWAKTVVVDTTDECQGIQ
ncbi:RDD family protein [Labilibaculum antarcticum]|uniref:RDD domain-containing protein n=1 Tax=Labilibaculum antarcticum TaxID=1717717 RepID=A0A1Y1CM50_9BACT|nr:RDD family protein [Labilibaculum antarcticum]BAX81467.1 hypothetical protein ALGA_3167 [Labilibaculum antarcticum]